MENERPAKRHSLLPQRSTSIANNPSVDEGLSKLAVPSKPKQRDISPSKLPLGGMRRGASVRQTPSTAKQASFRAQPASSSKSRDELPIITPARTAMAPPGITSRKPTTTTKTPTTHLKSGSLSSRPGSSHKPSTSVPATPVTSSSRPASSGKDIRAPSAAAPRTASRALANVKIQRPASTTLQRSPSPKKAPKTPTINKFALLTTGPTPALKPIQDAKLELLHLHTLHKESHATKAQWTQSAKDHYEKQFKRLVQLEEDLKASEMEFLEQQNATALIDWCREVCSSSGDSKTKALSAILNEMWLLVSPGGRYTATVTAFEDWYKMVETELDHRLHDCHVDIMEGLGDGWKAEVDALMSALCRMSDDLEGLGPAIEPSDLVRCLDVIMTMLANMLEELVLVRDIEQTLVEREGNFVKGRIDGLTAKVSGVA